MTVHFRVHSISPFCFLLHYTPISVFRAEVSRGHSQIGQVALKQRNLSANSQGLGTLLPSFVHMKSCCSEQC